MYEKGKQYIWQTKRWSLQGEGGVVLTVRGTRGLLLTVLQLHTHTENIEEPVVSQCTVRMLSGWVVAACHREILRMRICRIPSKGHLLVGG
jgi:hypothetical protein